MEVIWLRHGTRDFITGDGPLNTKGLDEAEHLATNYQLHDIDTIICSPKKRAQMTVHPLALKLGLDILIEEDLDQMNILESEQQFRHRIQNIIGKIESAHWNQKNLLLCSHSDWLSLATSLIPTDALDISFKSFQCAEYIKFEIRDGLWIV